MSNEKVSVILCHDGLESTIRSIKYAIDILQEVSPEDSVYPLANAINILNDAMWDKFNIMCSNKRVYTKTEWFDIFDEHNKKPKIQKHEEVE